MVVVPCSIVFSKIFTRILKKLKLHPDVVDAIMNKKIF